MTTLLSRPDLSRPSSRGWSTRPVARGPAARPVLKEARRPAQSKHGIGRSRRGPPTPSRIRGSRRRKQESRGHPISGTGTPCLGADSRIPAGCLPRERRKGASLCGVPKETFVRPPHPVGPFAPGRMDASQEQTDEKSFVYKSILTS